MKKKSIICIIAVSSVILVILMSLFSIGLNYLFSFLWLTDESPIEPTIKHGEFPFELVYKVDGEIVTVNDIYVCEYERIYYDFERGGMYITWDAYVKSTGKKDLLIAKLDDAKIYLVGDADYFMDSAPYSRVYRYYYEYNGFDPSEEEYSPSFYVTNQPDWYWSTETISEEYNIEFISLKFSEPIDNSFKKCSTLKAIINNAK